MDGVLDPSLYHTVVDSMSAHVAILDDQGVIIDTNRAWKEFALQNGVQQAFDGVGVNYLNVCDSAGDSHENDAGKVAEGIRKVLSGDLPEFLTHYPCHSPDEKRWYAVRVVPFLCSTSEHRHVEIVDSLPKFRPVSCIYFCFT